MAQTHATRRKKVENAKSQTIMEESTLLKVVPQTSSSWAKQHLGPKQHLDVPSPAATCTRGARSDQHPTRHPQSGRSTGERAQ